jgi:pimeloyl-ACP methyl ester carboxylesterase
MKTIVRTGILLLIIIAVPIGSVTVSAYSRDMSAARQRIENGGSVVIETGYGPIEHASVGQGPPVLAIHGSGGGYDQGLLLAEMALGDGFRVIAPSRFGYLGTPAREDDTPAAQADAHASLLDALGIDRVAVVGLSAGGPSALQFALRHPHRTAALVMISAVSPLPSLPQSQPDIVFKAIFGTDFGYWAMTTLGREQLVSMLGVTPDVQATLSPEGDALIEKALQVMHPASLRRTGIYADMAMDQYLASVDFPMQEISAPTHAYGQYTADQIPGARLVTLATGGHMSAGQQDYLTAEVTSFLNDYAGSETAIWAH